MLYVKLLNFIFTQLIVKFQYFLRKQNFPCFGKCDMSFRMIFKNLPKKFSKISDIFQHFHNISYIKI